MTQDNQKKAQEYFKSRLEDFESFKKAIKVFENDAEKVEVLGATIESEDDLREMINDYFLSIEKTADKYVCGELDSKQYKFLIGWGGPSDWLEVEIGLSGEIKNIVYCWQDWFIAPVKINLTGQELETIADVLEWAFCLDCLE